MEWIAESEIKEKLAEHHGGDLDRDLVKNSRGDGHDPNGGSVIYSLRGSPPKGYAIAIPELREVSFYDNRGKRFRRMRETGVVEVSAEQLDSVDEFHAGGVYAVPVLGRLGSKAWDVGMVDNTAIYYVKRSGSSGGPLGWDDRLSTSDRTLRELVEDGEVYKIGESRD
jgi:hypothetical protein